MSLAPRIFTRSVHAITASAPFIALFPSGHPGTRAPSHAATAVGLAGRRAHALLSRLLLMVASQHSSARHLLSVKTATTTLALLIVLSATGVDGRRVRRRVATQCHKSAPVRSFQRSTVGWLALTAKNRGNATRSAAQSTVSRQHGHHGHTAPFRVGMARSGVCASQRAMTLVVVSVAANSSSSAPAQTRTLVRSIAMSPRGLHGTRAPSHAVAARRPALAAS